MTEASVEHTTAACTSREPARAECRALLPLCRCRWIASRTTTALSTSMPTASMSPIMERILSVRCVKYRIAAAPSNENGMAVATTSVVGTSRRKNRSTSTASSAPISPASSRPLIEPVISSPWSVKVSTSMPRMAGSWPTSARAARARRATSTLLAPDSLYTFSPMARSWSRCRPYSRSGSR